MDIYCTRCGEPWALDYVLHDDEEGFERTGSVIASCPACQGREVAISKPEAERLAVIRELARFAGDDLDGFAADLEDFGL